MKYTTEEALAEIMRRSDQIIIRRDRRTCCILFGAVCALFAALIVVIGIQPGRSATTLSGTVYGAFLLAEEAGGYILVAVIAFVLGVAVTMLSLRRILTQTTEMQNKEEMP